MREKNHERPLTLGDKLRVVERELGRWALRRARDERGTGRHTPLMI